MRKEIGISLKAFVAGKRLVEKIKSGKIREYVPVINVEEKPNDEQEDYIRFLEFIKSDFFKKLKKSLLVVAEKKKRVDINF